MEKLKQLLIANGADLVGFADLREISFDKEMPFGVSVAVKLSSDIIESLRDGPNLFYFEEYNRINDLLNKIVAAGAEYLVNIGFKAFAQTTTLMVQTSDHKTVLPHKTVATKAGLGWIGKCGLLVSHEFGSGIRISSFITNAKLTPSGKPVEKSSCGHCAECVKSCPAKAISGKVWDVTTERSELIDVEKCIKAAKERAKKNIGKEMTLCGVCFAVCPHTIKNMKEQNLDIIIRPENEGDYSIVEDVTREAFWNIHCPGADEHLLVHNLRKADAFIKELDFVATYNNKIIGNIMYAQATVKNKNTVITFGPISVLPEYQKRGVGGKLINHTIQLSKEMGYKGIVIYGDPEYYTRFGFKESKEYNITDKNKKFPASLLVLELYPDALNGIEGIFDEGSAYEIDKNEAEEFDKKFAAKEKGYLQSQKRFKELSNKYL